MRKTALRLKESLTPTFFACRQSLCKPHQECDVCTGAKRCLVSFKSYSRVSTISPCIERAGGSSLQWRHASSFAAPEDQAESAYGARRGATKLSRFVQDSASVFGDCKTVTRLVFPKRDTARFPIEHHHETPRRHQSCRCDLPTTALLSLLPEKETSTVGTRMPQSHSYRDSPDITAQTVFVIFDNVY